MNLHLLLFAWYTSFPAQLTADSINRDQPIRVTMENLIPVSLPSIRELKHGNTPVDVSFEEAMFDPETNLLIVRGLVSDQREKIEIPGARVALGTLDSTKATGPIFSSRASVMTDYQGQFHLAAKLKQSDVLVIIWLGYLEKVFVLKGLVENHE